MASQDGSDEEDENEERGGVVGFMFGNVDKNFKLEETYIEEDAKEQLDALEDDRLGGEAISDLKGLAAEKVAAGQEAAAADDPSGAAASAPVDYSGEQEMAVDEAVPLPQPGISLIQAQLGNIRAAAAAAEEDDYDAEEEDEAAAVTATASVAPTDSALPALIATTALQVVQLPPAPYQPAAGLPGLLPPASATAPTVALASITAGPSEARRAVTDAEQRERFRAAGVELPVLAQEGGRSLLRFSELFAPQLPPDAIAAAAVRSRAPRQIPSSVHGNKENNEDQVKPYHSAAMGTEAADEADVLHSVLQLPQLEESEEEDEEGFSAGEEEEQQKDAAAEAPAPEVARRAAQKRHQQLRHARLSRQQAGESLVPAQSSGAPKEAAAQLPELPDALHEAVATAAWEDGILWASDEEANDIATDRNGNAACAVEEEEEEEGDEEGGHGQAAIEMNGNAAAVAPAPVRAMRGDDAELWGDLEEALQEDAAGSSGRTSSSHPEHRAHLEPLSKGEPVAANQRSKGPQLHPQMLRLENLSITAAGQAPSAAARGSGASTSTPDGGAAEGSLAVAAVPVAVAASKVLRRYNEWLEGGAWAELVGWESAAALRPPRLLLDMNDPHLIFEALADADPELLARAAASVLPHVPKVQIIHGPQVGRGEAAADLARYNVSKDHHYFQQVKRKGEKGLVGTICKHATPALSLLTLPVKVKPPSTLNHRPRGLWVPPPLPAATSAKLKSKRLTDGNAVVKVSSLVHGAVCESLSSVALERDSAAQLWEAARGHKFAAAKDEAPRLVAALPGQPPFLLDKLQVPLAAAGIPSGEMRVTLYCLFSMVRLLPTAVANAVPPPDSNVPTRPPAAFSKKKELTPVDGHIVLLEYVEEHPLLLSRPGMGVKLVTYYRKRSATDADHQKLRSASDKWRVGTVVPLQPEEDSPFLGNLGAGASQLAVEANMFRSPAFAHAPASSDFLLVRAATGQLALREITGALVAGQQEPQLRVPAPLSKEKRDIEERRLSVHIWRELRARQAKLAKRGDASLPEVSLKELQELFPALSETAIKARLRDRCDCVPIRGEDQWQLREGGRIPGEGELRKMMPPDTWCSHESMRAGLARLRAAGVTSADRLASVPQDKFQLAAAQLPNIADQAIKDAVQLLEVACQTTPWALTDNYISAMREGRGHLALKGVGDPSGRGRGFSFTRDTRRAAAPEGKVAVPKQGQKAITGTEADLRRLSMDASRQVLLKMGVTDAEISKLTRWSRIALVRELSSAAAADGSAVGAKFGSRYARTSRLSAAEQQQKYQEKSQEIFDHQAAALRGDGHEADEAAAEDSDDDFDLEDELENVLGSDDGAAKKGKKAKAAAAQQQPAEEDEEAELQRMRQSGLVAGGGGAVSSAGAAGTKPALEAKPGARRLRRTIFYNGSDGERHQRELIYTDREKVMGLHALAAGAGRDTIGPWNFYSRHIKGSKCSYGKGGRGMGRGGGRGGARPAARRKESAVRCSRCKEIGHSRSNRACPMYGAESDEDEFVGEAEMDDLGLEDDGIASPGKKRANAAGGRRANPRPKRQRTDPDLDVLGLLPEDPEYTPHRTPSKGPPKKKAVSGRKALNTRVLQRIAAALKKDARFAIFREAVAKTTIGDYNRFIPLAEEMYLSKAEKKAKALKYTSANEFRADLAAILRNAESYNTPGRGAYAYEPAIGIARDLVSAAEVLLAAHEAEIEDAEASIQEEAAALAPPPTIVPAAGNFPPADAPFGGDGATGLPTLGAEGALLGL